MVTISHSYLQPKQTKCRKACKKNCQYKIKKKKNSISKQLSFPNLEMKLDNGRLHNNPKNSIKISHWKFKNM